MAGVEGVVIKVLDHGVEVKQVANNREIFLNKMAWQVLCACRIQLNDAVLAEKEFQRTLDGRPTRTGVAMVLGEWDQVKRYLDPSDEMRLGVEVLRRTLKQGNLF